MKYLELGRAHTCLFDGDDAMNLLGFSRGDTWLTAEERAPSLSLSVSLCFVGNKFGHFIEARHSFPYVNLDPDQISIDCIFSGPSYWMTKSINIIIIIIIIIIILKPTPPPPRRLVMFGCD